MQRTETFNIATPHIEIDNVTGKVEFANHDEPTVVVTVATLKSNAEEIVEATSIVARGNTVKIEVPGRPGIRRREVLVRVIMPISATVQVSTIMADVDGRGSLDAAVVKSLSGDIRFETIVRSADLKTISGDVQISFSPKNVSTTSTSGDIHLDHFSGNGSVKSVSGDCLVHASGPGEISIRSVSGDVTVRVDPDIEIDVLAQTVSGNLTSEIDLEGTNSAKTEPGLTIRSRTVSGDVRIRRASLVS
jgi:uncharacterized protein (AIM24 family)